VAAEVGNPEEARRALRHMKPGVLNRQDRDCPFASISALGVMAQGGEVEPAPGFRFSQKLIWCGRRGANPHSLAAEGFKSATTC
jgi:hypothetical protein